jgi:flagellar hook-basal body complex protein FliE
MKTDAINIGRMVPGLVERLEGTNKTADAPSGLFAEKLAQVIDSVNDLQSESARMQDAFMTGEPVELHQVMIKAEEAGLAMDLLLEVRDKLVSAYNELARMPM